MATQDLSHESVDSLRNAKSKLTRAVIIFVVLDSMLVLAFTFMVIKKGLTGSVAVFLPLLMVPMLTMIPTFTKLGAVNKELERRTK